MTFHKAAFWRHKAPKRIYTGRNTLGLHHHFQPAKGDPLSLPQTSTGLLHTSGPVRSTCRTAGDPFGPPTSTVFSEIEEALPGLAGAWAYHRP
jgi:hypothetical protein